jgi:hypothetical protein
MSMKGLTVDVDKRAHSGCDQSAEDAYSSITPDPTIFFLILGSVLPYN